jgi:hypothetical protein
VEGFLALDGQTGTVILFFVNVKGLQVSKTLQYVTSHFVNISGLGCNSLSLSQPWFSAVRFPNSLINPHHMLTVVAHVLFLIVPEY